MGKKSSRKTGRRLVAVLVDTSTQWGRSLIEGVTSYASEGVDWDLLVETHGRDDAMQLPKDWNGDGIIARISSKEIAKKLRQLKLPVVNISGIKIPHCQFPRVTTDYEGVSRMAAAHFRSRGFQNYAYIGPLDLSYVQLHSEAFADQLSGTESELLRFNYAVDSMASSDWLRQKKRLESWLSKLPKPVAVFGWGTSAPSQVIRSCRSLGINVPDEISVLAGAHDGLIARATRPAMSTVIIPSLQIGFHAAARLERLMNGQSDHGETELFTPIEIITRGSTESLAIEDPELLAAVQFLRKNAFSELTIQAVADSVPMTRRSLERKFKERVGRAPLAELRRLRIARVKELLATTDLSMPRIALASGFGTPEYMATIFKRETSLTPLKYRSRTRAR